MGMVARLGAHRGYAVGKGVGIILWSPWAAFIGCQEEACRRYAEIGVKGFKLDGICRNDRYLTHYLEETARIAAKYRLVIDYHGVSKPSGLNRTYPNADRDATDYVRTVATVRAGEKLTAKLAPGGGWTARLTRVE